LGWTVPICFSLRLMILKRLRFLSAAGLIYGQGGL